MALAQAPSLLVIGKLPSRLKWRLYVWMLLLQPCRTCRGGGTKGASDL